MLPSYRDDESKHEEQNSDEEDEEDNDVDWTEIDHDGDGTDIELNSELKTIIKSIRKIVNTLCNSPVKNYKLGEHVMIQPDNKEGKSKALIQDIPTRWNALLHSISRFLEIRYDFQTDRPFL